MEVEEAFLCKNEIGISKLNGTDCLLEGMSCDTQPNDLGDLLFDEYAHQGHNHNIQSCDKAGLSGSGHTDAELLQGACDTQDYTANRTADQ